MEFSFNHHTTNTLHPTHNKKPKLHVFVKNMHKEKTKKKTKTFQKDKNAKGLKVKMVFNLCTTCVELVGKKKPLELHLLTKKLKTLNSHKFWFNKSTMDDSKFSISI